ncbi:MAG: molybdopterin-dependent oxidoreductase [Deltaproteobacteria bacterium]|nr:molybdopterin-dependent oxidoreductase [Deltaproteobacteria bacterium]
MQAVTLTINDQTVSARAGRTILEVARELGIDIPTLCHHEFLRPIGACRLCQVEWLDRGVVVPACVTTIAPGMNLRTDSERVEKNRRNIIRLLLASHPESCLVCNKGNLCELRQLAARLGVGEHGLDPVPYHPGVQDLNPFLARDLSKCIMCAKCLRADQDLVEEGVIDYHQRGFDAYPATPFNLPLEEARCTFCGTCLTVCPTGAIYEKHRPCLDHLAGREASVCGYCASGCAIFLEHDGQRVVGVAPTQSASTANGVTLCVKGRFGFDYLASPERLSTPLVKENGEFRPISWDAALALAARRLREIAAREGGAALGFLGSARATNEENYLLQKLARTVGRTNNVTTSAGLYYHPAAELLGEATGFAAGSLTLPELADSRVIFLLGGDPTRTSPVVGYHVKRAVRRGARLVLVDPLQGKLASRADPWLAPVLGGEAEILWGLLKVLAEEDLFNHKFVGAKTKGLERLNQALAGVAVADCAARAGVGVSQLRDTARLLAAADTVAFIFGRSAVQDARGPEIVSLLVDLALVTGNLGRRGAGLLPLLTDCNTQGALDMGCHPAWLPGHRALEDEAARARLARLWGAAPPAWPGLDYLGLMQAAGRGSLKALWIMADNPLARVPGREAAARALANLEFLVVQDLFLSDTARQAHLVLPAAGFAESGGTYTNLERRVQQLNPAVPPPGGFPANWQVLARLAELGGAAWPYESWPEVSQEIAAAAPCYQGLFEVAAASRAAAWPLPGAEELTDTLPHGIGHPDGRALFLTPTRGTAPPAPEGFPYRLLLGRELGHLGEGLRSSHSARLQTAFGRPCLEVSPADWEALALEGAGAVRVASPHGELTLAARREGRLPQGVMFLAASHPALGHTALWEAAWGGSGPAPRECWVRAAKSANP